jgi:SNF2 family DNA or RNA helicase
MADVFVVNPDGLPWLLGVRKTTLPSGKTKVDIDMARWKNFGFDGLIVDELSKFKDTSTQRFKMLRHVLPTFGRRWGLTGSPAPNGLIDLFGQAYVLDEGRTFGRFVTNYRTNFFVPSWDGFSWELRDGADKEIYKRLKPLALRMAAEDYLDMPKLVENEVTVTLPKEARRVYDELEDALYVEIGDKKVIASNAAAASTKCRQVANGGVYVDDSLKLLLKAPKSEREWVDLHLAKVEAVSDLVDELQGEPLLVAYDFEHDLARLKDRFGPKTPHIGGGTTTKAATAIEAAWNAGKISLLLGHPQSLAHGLNLQGAGFHVAWHSLTWNFELYEQFIHRVWRQGQKASRVFVHHIIAEDTIDRAILAALRSKKKGQQALFDALRARGAVRKVRS